jgi:hypothetical protein
MEFAEVRPYQPGDDVRAIDWNVTARMGEPFVKQFVEERDLTVFLVVDVSGSLRFGSRAVTKRELAAEVAALLAFAALRNHDRVGAALVSDRLELLPAAGAPAQPGAAAGARDPRLARGGRHRPRTRPRRGAGQPPPARRAVRRLRLRRLAAGERAQGGFRAPRRCRARGLRPARPRAAARRAGRLEDAETGRLAIVDGRRAAAGEAARVVAERARLESLLTRLGIDRLELRTDRPYLPEVVRFFERRGARRRSA